MGRIRYSNKCIRKTSGVQHGVVSRADNDKCNDKIIKIIKINAKYNDLMLPSRAAESKTESKLECINL